MMAQPELTIYTDAGKNNTSKGLFIKSATMGCYKFGKNRVGTGFQLDLKNSNNYGFSGYTINISRNLLTKRIPLELQGFFVLTRPYDLLQETNWGTLLKMKHKRFGMELGTNFRTYTLTKQAIKDYDSDKHSTKIHEVFNLMYSFNFFLKPTDEQWNVGLSVTNIDHYIINQETNPVFNLQGFYKLKSPVKLFAQAWYKTAGITNLNLNYFGFFLRTGIIWNIN